MTHWIESNFQTEYHKKSNNNKLMNTENVIIQFLFEIAIIFNIWYAVIGHISQLTCYIWHSSIKWHEWY